MSDPDNQRKIRLHFESVGSPAHMVPARVLVESLRQVQQIIYLLAKFHRGDEFRQRARPSHDLEKRFALVCKVPEEGSYALAAEIGDLSASENDLFDDGEIKKVSRAFHEVTQAIAQGSLDRLRRVVPDGAYRKSLLESFKAAQPPKRFGLVFSIEDSEHRKLLDGSKIEHSFTELDRSLVGANGDNTLAYVTGTLVRMHFEERRLQLKLLNGRGLDATYGDDFEPVLLDHPRDLIQVHGDVTYDDQGIPTSLAEVDEIIAVDESPIEIRELTVSNTRYRADPPLRFEVSFNREDHLYNLEGDFDVTLSAEARPELEDALDETLAMLWTEYGQGQPQRLSPQAQQMRDELRERIRDVCDGA